MIRTYLDHNATSPMRPSVKSVLLQRLGAPLNPSSVHAEGREGRKVLETARNHVARLVGADPKAVIFTSGGTEANNTVLSPVVQRGSEHHMFDRLFVSAVEHPCVLSGGRFEDEAIATIPVTEDGVVDLNVLPDLLATAEKPFVSVMLANNETGALQPITDIAEIVANSGGFLHVDAVQAAGKIAIDIKELRADVLTLSAHKLGGPQGVGAIVAAHAGIRFPSALKGGGQELGQRGGTENVAGIEGFGVACQDALDGLSDGPRVLRLRDQLEKGLRSLSNEITIFSDQTLRLPNTVNFSLPGKRAETSVITYDMAGLAVSSGSACSSGKVGPSHVLQAMGVEQKIAEGAIRVSLGWSNTEEDVERFLNATAKMMR